MKQDALETILSQHPFFSAFLPEYIALLAAYASEHVFHIGDFLCEEGKAADRFYLLREGQVAIDVSVPVRGRVTVQTLSHGDILGWSWLIPPYVYDFDGRATALTRAVSLDAAKLRQLCEDDHSLGYTLLKHFSGHMVRRLHRSRIQLLDMYGLAP